jgi:hypothetical protein
MASRATLRHLALVACVLLAGCRGDTSPGAAGTPASPDEDVLDALEPYDPVYQLDANGRVVRLKLEGKRIPPSAVEVACRLSELRYLSLYGASIGDNDLENLQNLQNLRSLGLAGTAVTEKGLVHLAKLPALQWLWVGQQLVPSPGVDALQAANPGLTIYPQ